MPHKYTPLGFNIAETTTPDADRVIIYIDVVDTAMWNKTMQALLTFGHVSGDYGASISKSFMCNSSGKLIKEWSVDIWGNVEAAMMGLDSILETIEEPDKNNYTTPKGMPRRVHNPRTVKSEGGSYEEFEVDFPFTHPGSVIPSGNNHDNPVPLKEAIKRKYGTTKVPSGSGG